MAMRLPGLSPEKLVEELETSFNLNSFRPFITSIRFPNYKNIDVTTRLDFNFPITVLLGKNGTNKSSILQALYGVPYGYSTGQYWFSTILDPIIDDGDDTPKGKPRFIYSYYIPELSQNVEVLNNRAGVSKGLDYWEPARPKISDGMAAMPAPNPREAPYRSKTRWNSVRKPCLILDFRSEISAYDRAFNYLDRPASKLISSTQDFIRRRSKHLNDVIKNNLQSFVFSNKERIFLNYIMDSTETAWSSYILGKNYTEIRIILHSLFDSKSLSVYLKSSKNYSEALAGSGETAICSLVYKIYNSDNNSLVLLDEPEVSLHPGAQKRFIEFLLAVAKFKKCQIVISSHSPSIIENLPRKSLRLAKINDLGLVEIIEDVSKDEVFIDIEAKTNKIKLFCEDITMRDLINRLKRPNGELFKDYFEVIFLPGGADAIKKRHIIHSFEKNDHDVCYLIDGDKKSGDMPDPDTIPPSRSNDLEDMIKTAMGHIVKLEFNSTSSKADKDQKYRDFMKFYNQRVVYFPYKNPEEMLISEVLSKDPMYNDALTQTTTKSKIYYSALKYYNVTSATNSQVESFMLYKFGQIDNLEGMIEPIAEFLDNIIRSSE